MASRIQQRAICPACFAQQAVKGGRLVQHGYTRPQQWHANVGTCSGTGEQHFGTEAGRDVTQRIAVGLVRNADALLVTADDVVAGTATVYGRKRIASGHYTSVAIDNPTAAQRAQYAAQLRAESASCRAAAVEYRAKVAAWQAADPIAATVETKETIVHFRAHYYNKHGHKACAASAMGAMRGYAVTTTIAAEVTCERCKQRKVYVAAATAQGLTAAD
jgi:hypothetical protein